MNPIALKAPRLTLMLICAAVSFVTNASDDPFARELLAIEQKWDAINYDGQSDASKAIAFEALETRAHEVSIRYAERAEAKVWEGIVLSSWADAKDGLGGLALAKRARDRLDEAIAQDPDALDGAAYVALGVLYYKVPGFPLGFGDKRKADALLKLALAHDPDGIDSNFYYGEFLYEQGRYGEALIAARRAASAAPRPDRPTGDQGRRMEIAALLEAVRRKLR